MKDIKSSNFEFPAAVYHKDDIINAIAKNITDAEILNDIVSSVEKNAHDYICDGDWAALPLIGSVKPNARYESLRSNAYRLRDAKQIMNRTDYINFKRELSIKELKRIKRCSSIYYAMNLAKNKHKAIHKIKCSLKGEQFASLYCYFYNSLKPL